MVYCWTCNSLLSTVDELLRGAALQLLRSTHHLDALDAEAGLLVEAHVVLRAVQDGLVAAAPPRHLQQLRDDPAAQHKLVIQAPWCMTAVSRMCTTARHGIKHMCACKRQCSAAPAQDSKLVLSSEGGIPLMTRSCPKGHSCRSQYHVCQRPPAGCAHLCPRRMPRQDSSTTTSSMWPTMPQPRMNLRSRKTVPQATICCRCVSASFTVCVSSTRCKARHQVPRMGHNAHA